MQNAISIYDYIVIGFYLVFMLALGPVYKSFSKTASDYFRGGGGMLWWVVGASAFMTTFSAWSFTGGAGEAYETGTFFLLLFLANFIGLFVTYFVTAQRFRQMRIITAIEAVRKRYCDRNEQFFTWLPLITRILFTGVGLYTIAVFMFGVFRADLSRLMESVLGYAPQGTMIMGTIIVVLGMTAILMTLVGGSWAATAGDFVQMIMLLAVTILMAGLCLWHKDIGGPVDLVRSLPPEHLDWTVFQRPWIIVFFFVFLLINQTMQTNSMLEGASKYVFVKDGRDAKKSVMISIVGFLFLSPIWLIPAITARVIFPDLSQVYPELNNPSEGAYVAMACNLLPKGLLGLMICAIFAASMTSLNSGLNIASGTFVRNFYIRILDKSASESKQILVGRLFTLFYGILCILVGLVFAPMKGLRLYDLIMLVAGAVGLPAAIPLFLGMFVKRTPKWSAWSTMVLGFSTSLVLAYCCRSPELTRDFITGIFHPQTPFLDSEVGKLKIGLAYALIGGLCVGWYFLTMLFYKKDEAYEAQVDEFFEEMNTPINTAKEHGPTYDSDARQYGVLGTLCLVYGGFVLFLMLIPNSLKDRLMILLVGGVISVAGFILRMIAKKIRMKVELGDRSPV